MSTNTQPLSAKAKKQLRKLGHKLHPVVQIGAKGMKKSIIEATEEALLIHELIKIKANVGDKDERKTLFEKIAAKTDAQIVASIGFTSLMYKRNPDDPKINLPQ